MVTTPDGSVDAYYLELSHQSGGYQAVKGKPVLIWLHIYFRVKATRENCYSKEGLAVDISVSCFYVEVVLRDHPYKRGSCKNGVNKTKEGTDHATFEQRKNTH